jgi:D-alanyl-D-alanine carboxypeptidase/D-alanyl-D-alanine-endopeptidase (penicillin-binding protein 4)
LDLADTSVVRIGYDASLFEGPTSAAAWPSEYVASGVVGPVTALSVGEGHVADPPRQAGLAFSRQLERAGITVRGPLRSVDAGADAPLLAKVDSRPVAELVRWMLTESDNDYAEAFGHLIAVATGGPATFSGGAAATKSTVADLGVDTADVALFDASGLARTDRIPAATLTSLLVASMAPDRPELSVVLSGLPVAAFTGTLEDRFVAGPAAAGAGVVRAKTGTLTGVSTLAGTVADRQGRVLTFAFLADEANDVLEARAALDRAAAALARCGCR